MNTSADLSNDYFGSIARSDVHGASDLVVDLLDEGRPLDSIVTSVLAPAQVRVGEQWASGAWSVADEHVATSITEGALSALANASRPRPEPDARHVAVVCAEGEWHSLPARMAATIAAATGEVRVTMLGPSLPAEQLHRRLRVGDIDVLALSCTMPTNLVGAARCVATAHTLGVPVIAGGRAFGSSSRRAQAIGADAWAADASAIMGPAPTLGSRGSDIPIEVLMLDNLDDAIITVAYQRLMAAHPGLASMSTYQQACTREDLGRILRHTAAALLTDDDSIVEDLLAWQCTRLSEIMPASVITTTAQLLAETIEPQTPSGAAILGRAAAQVEVGMARADARMRP